MGVCCWAYVLRWLNCVDGWLFRLISERSSCAVLLGLDQARLFRLVIFEEFRSLMITASMGICWARFAIIFFVFLAHL